MSRRAVRDDGAVGEPDRPPRTGGEIEIVRHEDEGGAELAIELRHEVDHAGAGAHVQVAGGLIGKENPGPVAERACQRDALLLAAGELRRVVMAAVGEPDPAEELVGARATLFAAQLKRHLHVFPCGERRNQLERLKDEAHLGATQLRPLVLVERTELLAVEMDGATRRAVEPGEQSEQGGLAAARWPDDGEKAARLERERDILQHGQLTAAGEVGLGERLATKHGGMIVRYKLVFAALAAMIGCSERRPGAATGREQGSPDSAGLRPSTDTRPMVVFLGTSLTSGAGLADPDQAYPALIQARIDAARLSYRVVNGGVSGETSAGLLHRVDWMLRQPAAVVVIETGANDGLRGLDVGSLRANVQGVIDRIRRDQPAARIVLIGMRALPNLGAIYSQRFASVFPDLARQNGVPLVPFLLEGVAGVPRLNQADGVHPTVEGQRRLAETVWRVLEPVLTAP